MTLNKHGQDLQKQWMMTEESMKESRDKQLDHPVVLMLETSAWLHVCVECVFLLVYMLTVLFSKCAQYVLYLCVCGVFYVSGYKQIQ